MPMRGAILERYRDVQLAHSHLVELEQKVKTVVMELYTVMKLGLLKERPRQRLKYLAVHARRLRLCKKVIFEHCSLELKASPDELLEANWGTAEAGGCQ